MSCDSLPPLQLMMLCSHVNSFGIVHIYTVQKDTTCRDSNSREIMKMIKTRLRNHLSDLNLTHLMRIAIEGPRLNLVNFNEILDIFKETNRCINI